MYSGPLINIHAHLHKSDDIPGRMAIWRKWKVRKIVCLSVHKRWEAAGYLGNEDHLPLIKRYPDIIAAFAAVNLMAGQTDAPEQIDRYKGQGFTGLKFEDNTYPYNHAAYWPLYERAQALGMPILFHTGWLAPVVTKDGVHHDGPDGIDAENMRPYLLDKVARSFPGLTIIGAHLGLPHSHEALQMMEAYPRVYFDFCGGGGAKPHLRKVAAALMPPLPDADMTNPEEHPALGLFERKLMFGTDNPEPDVWVPAAEWIMDKLRIPEKIRVNFYCKTAAALFGWKIE
jgi:predicted TIM-barrel fold metal-dependent hydrolase